MALGVLLMVAFSARMTSASVQSAYLYDLANFTGIIPYGGANVFLDEERNEVYVLFQNIIRIFNDKGMEVYQFGENLDVGHIVDGAVEPDGNILLLAYDEGVGSLYRCNYRGDLTGQVTVTNLPAEFLPFHPNRLACRNGRIYLASTLGLKVVAIDAEGRFQDAYDLEKYVELTPEEREKMVLELGGFSVDDQENLVYTITVLFKVYQVSTGTKSAISFGKAGGAPGKFNIIAGVVRDHKGNYLVADKLKSAIIVFDETQSYVLQFGYRGLHPGSLIVPSDLAVDRKDRLYVTQGARRGVSAFQLTYN